MNFNTILLRFGFDPDNFINQYSEPVHTENGFIYEVSQRTDVRVCPDCGSTNCYINNYSFVEVSCTQNSKLTDTLRIKKVRFKCSNCGRTFTPDIRGVQRGQTVSTQVLHLITASFFDMVSFQDIAECYALTSSRIIQIFDEKFPEVPRTSLPEVLCIDEKKFSEETDQKYVCILYDYKNECVVDVIRNRRLPYLREYFDSISPKERSKVRYFVSDMYDSYETIRLRYFPDSIHIIDLFHVSRLLTSAVNTLRIRTMNGIDKGCIEYHFMKRFWKIFLSRSEDIPDSFFEYADEREHFDDLVFRCVRKNDDFLTAYNILQDYYHYGEKRNYADALQFVEMISERLVSTDIRALVDIGNTFRKWKYGIANSISRSQNKVHYSNSVAENTNSHIQKLIDVSYGYHNFERFRKRILLIRTYKKQ